MSAPNKSREFFGDQILRIVGLERELVGEEYGLTSTDGELVVAGVGVFTAWKTSKYLRLQAGLPLALVLDAQS